VRKPSASARHERGGDASSTSARQRSARGRLRSRWLLVLSAAVFIALAVAATTQASNGIVGYFELGGEFEGSLGRGSTAAVGDIDVNANGTGGASPGDVYAASITNEFGGSVRQLSASDDFIRIWGPDTVKSGPGQANETQAIGVDATGGSFKLSFGGATTADLAANSSPAEVEAALNGLVSIGAGGVSVSGGPGDAGATNPYVVSFNGGSLAGTDQPQLKAANGSVPLSGSAASVAAYTTNAGGSGFEICDPANGDECREAGADGIGSIAVDQASGDVYITNNNGIEKYSASGQFQRAWGRDVVASGPDDSNVNEKKSVTVKATGGSFTLGYRKGLNAPVQSTPPLPFNAGEGAVEAALDNLNEIGGNYSSVSVSRESPGPDEFTYLITFHGLLGGDDLADVSDTNPLVANPSNLVNSGGEKSAKVATVSDGGGEEICRAAVDACKEGAFRREDLGAESSGPLSLRTFGSSLALAPAGSPNAGDVIAGSRQRQRVQEYTSEGAFVRTFGWDVDETEPSTGFEVCTAQSGDVCKQGTAGGGLGQFGELLGLAEDSSGAIYTVEGQTVGSLPPGSARRVQKFTPAGGLDLTPSPFGSDETQELTVNAGAGQFRLTLGAEQLLAAQEEGGTRGSGDVTSNSTTITNVITNQGEFAVGQILRNGSRSTFETEIVGVGPNTLTVAEPISVGSGSQTTENRQLVSGRPYKTPDLPYNASAAEVEAALDALLSVDAEGGSVSVTGGPGGSSPYTIHFDGGAVARTDLPQIEGSDGSTPLSGGSGAGANTANAVTTTPGGPGGFSQPSTPFDIATGPGDNVFVAKQFPETFTKCPNGKSSPFEIRIEELDLSGAVLRTSDPCTGLVGLGKSGSRRSSITVNQLTERPYLLNQNETRAPRINIFGPPGPAPTLSLEAVSAITPNGGTIAGTINPNGPGTGYPDTTGTPSVTKTNYRVEFKKASDSSWTRYTPDIPVGNGTDPVPFSVGVAGLAAKTPYEVKVIATKPFAGVVEETKSFTTGAAMPEIGSVSSSNVGADSADLGAKINPQGTETSYHFEYGTTPAYGQSTPETSIGEGLEEQPVSAHIEGLQDAVYHFRVVATNAIGTARSEDQTFNFHPPVCPNQTVRQQTGTAYLPDCRAYELVSPEDAGGTALSTGGPQSPYASNPPRLSFTGQLAAIPGSGRNPIDSAGDLYVATRGADGWHSRYIGPSSEEAACVGGRPLVSGAGRPSTIQNDVIADPGLNRIIDWNLGNPLECGFGSSGGVRFFDFNTAALGSNAPYVWNAHGDFLDRWPTAAADVAGSEANFSCPQDPSSHPYPPGVFGNIPVSYFCSSFVDASKDLNHFVFSTKSGLFGEGGLTTAPGSAYDNDTADNTLSLISKLPGGGPIAQEPGAKAGPEELIRFPAVSADGSHILMGTATKPECKQFDFPGTEHAPPLCPIVTQPTHLYMRVNDAVSYDVSGKPVHYIGATPDATKVFFTSDEELTADDTDTSTDLYMWSENGGSPTLTRISAGDTGSIGNSDECAASWTAKCDVKTYEDSAITATHANQGGLGSWTKESTNPGYTDNAIAAKSGDIYFYSPEQLVAGKGVPGKENLYVYRGGSLHEVAALDDDLYCLEDSCSNGALGRLQVTPDGRFAAFATTSRLTAYDNHGFAEMYRYEAEAEKVTCVSCRPDGTAPEGDVLGSEGGRFITDDGRVFFDTTEPLDPRDTNGGGFEGESKEPTGNDVYEFTGGRPQLISTGTGHLRKLGVSLAGLYGVSADGTDVYFGTFETLVGQDRNGQQLKFYDARTNGGFPFVPPPAPCAAADECHGPTAPAPAPVASGTGAALGAGGNTHKAKAHKHKRRHKTHRAKSHGKSKRASDRKAQNKAGGAR
jgi:hypothetical protein